MATQDLRAALSGFEAAIEAEVQSRLDVALAQERAQMDLERAEMERRVQHATSDLRAELRKMVQVAV